MPAVLGEEPVSVLQRGLAERLAGGFAKHPWVAAVERGGSAVPRPRRWCGCGTARRSPRCGPGPGCTRWTPPGCCSRRRTSPAPAADALPRIDGVNSVPGPAGTVWPRPRGDRGRRGVRGAGGGLGAVRPRRGPPAGRVRGTASGAASATRRFMKRGKGDAGAGTDPRFELFTRAGSRILWGPPAGDRSPGGAGDGHQAAAADPRPVRRAGRRAHPRPGVGRSHRLGRRLSPPPAAPRPSALAESPTRR